MKICPCWSPDQQDQRYLSQGVLLLVNDQQRRTVVVKSICLAIDILLAVHQVLSFLLGLRTLIGYIFCMFGRDGLD